MNYIIKKITYSIFILVTLLLAPHAKAAFSDGTFDQTFDTQLGIDSGYIQAIKPLPDSKILIAGNFQSFNGIVHNRIARLYQDGKLDTSFHTIKGADNVITHILIQSDKKILVGGLFSSYASSNSKRYLARLNEDGTLDSTFTPAAMQSAPALFLLQPNGKIIVGGGFFTPKRGLLRLNTNGTRDTTFNPGTGVVGGVESGVIQPDGKVLIGGNFTSYNGTPRNRIARVNSDGSLDASFDPGTGANFKVQAIALQSDGKILVGGGTTIGSTIPSYNSVTVTKLIRLNSDGSLDTSFDPGSGTQANLIANNTINSITIQEDGKILIGGKFSSYNGTPRNRIARVNSDGSLDASFDPGTGAEISYPTFYSYVQPVVIDNSKKLLIGGSFNSYNAISCKNIVRLTSTL